MRKAGRGAAVCAAAVLAGCSAGADLKAADAAIAGFHGELNAERYDAIWSGAAPQFRATTTEAALTRLLSAVHRKLGACLSAAPAGWNMTYGTGGRVATVGRAAKFEHGAATERFVFRMEGGRAVLLGYNVTSDALVLN